MATIVCPMCRTISEEGTIICPKCGLHFVEKKQPANLAVRHWETGEILATIIGTLALLSTAYGWIQYGFKDSFTIVSFTVTAICLLFFLVSALERWLNKN